ncbi:MAG: hypothetical protein RIR70_553 [Pseudomonadota bacterium]
MLRPCTVRLPSAPTTTNVYLTNNSASNTTDLAAIWDSRATCTSVSGGQSCGGTPPGWMSDRYWSAMLSASGHVNVGLNNGYVYGFADGSADSNRYYVTLRVL